MLRYLLTISLLYGHLLCAAQAKGGIEQYQYIGNGTANAIVPVLHFQDARGWYGEARYNYDEANTFSVLGGRSFRLDKSGSMLLTPMLGVSAGNFEGFTTAVNYSMEKGPFFFSAQSQYSFSSNDTPDFFFNWSEAGYQPLKWLFGGASVQYTKEQRFKGKLEPGLMLGFNWRNVSLPLYVFNVEKQERFFILGLVWEWSR